MNLTPFNGVSGQQGLTWGFDLEGIAQMYRWGFAS